MENLRPRRIGEILKVIWKRKRLLALITIAVLAATVFVIRRIPYKYESGSMIVIGKQATDEQRLEQAPRFSALVDQASSRDNLLVVIRKHDLYPEIAQVDDQLDTFKKDLKDLKLSTKIRDFYPPVPESLRIIYRHRDPAKAQQVVAEITNTFLQANAQLKQDSANEISRLAGLIAEVEEQLQRITPKKNLEQMRFEMLARRPDQTTALSQIQQRVSAQETIENLKDEKYRLERDIERKKTEIAEQEKIVKLASMVPSTTTSTVMGALLGRKAEIQAKIDTNTARGFRPKHPEMERLQNEMAQMDQQIARVESNPSQNSETRKVLLPEHRELRTMQGQLATLEAQWELASRKINSKTETLLKMPSPAAPPAQERLSDPADNKQVDTQYDKLLTRYEWLLGKHDEMVKIAKPDASAPPMYQMIEQPYLPEFPTAPNKLLLQALALALSLVFGLLVTFGAELPRFFLINDERDVEYYLGAPVLASIPETLTPPERSRKRKIKMTRSLLLLLLIGALVPALILVLNLTQIFQLLGNK